MTAGPAVAQQIENELVLITPVSKFIHDASLKEFAAYAKEKWGITVKTNALAAGTPVAYGRIVEWKGKPEVDISRDVPSVVAKGGRPCGWVGAPPGGPVRPV